MSIFSAIGRYIFGTLGNKAKIITQYYLVPRRLSTDPKMRDPNDLESFECPFYVNFCI